MRYDAVCPQCKSGQLVETNDYPEAKQVGGAPIQCTECKSKNRLRVFSGGFPDIKRENRK